MKKLGDLLALLGVLLFIYTVIGRFVGEHSIMGFSKVPLLGDGFTAVGMFSATACILLMALIAIIKGKQ